MCGIAGIISTENTIFNPNHFNILGALNDERGGDSCGIFIDGEYEYGIDDKALFRNFTTDIEYPKTAKIALLHCRKASPGYPVNIEQAQPVIITNNGKVEFVLMHNGTINNIQTLAIKYLPNVSTIGQSDSQILAQIIYKHGYDVLNEYTGCAVLVIIDYRDVNPKVLLFKGSSCFNETGSNSERPLYYMFNEGKFYFSSMYSSLYCINNKKTIYYFPVNKLCRLDNNKLFSIKDVDRSKLSKTTYVSKSYDNYYHNNVVYNKTTGIYTLNGAPAHGILTLYASGYLADKKYINNSINVYQVPFFHGRLLFNVNCYDFLNSLNDLFEEDVLLVYCPEVIDYFSYNPRMISGKLNTVDENLNYTEYLNGEYVTLFVGGDKISVRNGVSTSKYIYPSDALEEYLNTARVTFFNFTELESDILKLISNKLVNSDAI